MAFLEVLEPVGMVAAVLGLSPELLGNLSSSAAGLPSTAVSARHYHGLTGLSYCCHLSRDTVLSSAKDEWWSVVKVERSLPLFRVMLLYLGEIPQIL